MKLNRVARLRTIIVVLCALLLAQWSLAAHACPTLRLANPMPIESQAAADAAPTASDCAHEGDSQSTLGYKHCNVDEQASGSVSIVFAAPPPALVVARAVEPTRSAARNTRLGLAHAIAPPLIILYCVSLT